MARLRALAFAIGLLWSPWALAQGGGANANMPAAPCSTAFGFFYACTNVYSLFQTAPQLTTTAGALQIGFPAGGNTGNGTINITGNYYRGGVDIRTAPGSIGQLIYNNTLFDAFTLSGDCTISVPTITCFKSNGVAFESAAFAATGSSGHALPFLDVANTFADGQSFGSSLVAENDQSGVTYSLAVTDCGKTLGFSNGSAVTVTIPAAIVPANGTLCRIWIRQDGAGQVAVNGSAVTPATLVSASSFTKTRTQHSEIWLDITTTPSAVSTATLMGDGA